jgi:hypothetical protein
MPREMLLALITASDYGDESFSHILGCGRYSAIGPLHIQSFPPRGTTTKREPISNGEEPISQIRRTPKFVDDDGEEQVA